MRLLLDKGANINARDTFYEATPITWAVQRGYVRHCPERYKVEQEAEALEPRAYALTRTALRHAGGHHERASYISQIVNRRFLVAT